MKYFKIFLLSLVFQTGFAQELEKNQFSENITEVENKNLIKLNALALSIGNISLQYDRAIGSKVTIGTSVNFMPKRGLPFSSRIEDLVNDETTVSQLQKIQLSSFSVTPEIRYYFGKEVFRGFYVAPFLRYGTYSLKFPVNYTYENQNLAIDLEGKINAFSGGIAIGAQWKMAKDFYLDWLIVGPHYGNSNGSLAAYKDLNKSEQAAINQALKELDIPMVDYSYEVNNSGAKIKVKGPWTGFRASIGIAYRF